MLTDGRPWFQISNSNGDLQSRFARPFLADGDWHHIAVTSDGNGTVIFTVDGVESAVPYQQGSSNLFPNGTAEHLQLDISGFAFQGLNGDVADIRLWDRVLSNSEINESIAPSSLSGNEFGLIANWDFQAFSSSIAVPSNAPATKTAVLSDGSYLVFFHDNGDGFPNGTDPEKPSNVNPFSIPPDGDNLCRRNLIRQSD